MMMFPQCRPATDNGGVHVYALSPNLPPNYTHIHTYTPSWQSINSRENSQTTNGQQRWKKKNASRYTSASPQMEVAKGKRTRRIMNLMVASRAYLTHTHIHTHTSTKFLTGMVGILPHGLYNALTYRHDLSLKLIS